MSLPARGFEIAEFRRRTTALQAAMAEEDLDVLLLTSAADIQYVTGFLTRFWESPTRPWFVVVPGSGMPVAVIPSIGAALMASTWIEDIRTWDAPVPEDDGVTLLAATLAELSPRRGRLGAADGSRDAPADAGRRFRAAPRSHRADGGRGRHPGDPTGSRGEVPGRDREDPGRLPGGRRRLPAGSRHGTAGAPARRGLPRIPDRVSCRGGRLGELSGRGCGTRRIWRRDLPGIEPSAGWWRRADARHRARCGTDTFAISTGTSRSGQADDAVRRAYATLFAATEAGLSVARPGATAADLHSAMAATIVGKGGTVGSGRFGHGLGLQLTEWPSLLPSDRTVLREGMVLTLEPSLEIAPGRIMVHEENIVIRASGAELLSPRAPGGAARPGVNVDAEPVHVSGARIVQLYGGRQVEQYRGLPSTRARCRASSIATRACPPDRCCGAGA